MYTLAVGALFKNESQALKEWIDHYLFHGVEHFYLIDDASTDNSVSILQEYIDKDIVSLYSASCEYYYGRQTDLYNKYILPHIKETEWLLMVDLDEFLWSPISIHLPDILKLCYHYGQIQVCHTLFGSNGHIEQPKSIVEGFTKRSSQQPTHEPIGNRKYFINTRFEFSSLVVHNAKFKDSKYDTDYNVFTCLGPDCFILNHYCCQSLNFWKEVKCTRGDSNHYAVRTEDHFKQMDINEVEDLRLLEQNRPIL
jgi:hypothetical protein